MTALRTRRGRWTTRWSDWRLWVAVPAVLLLMALPSTMTPISFGGSQPSSSTSTNSQAVCPFTAPETFTSRTVNLASPTFALAAGDSITSVYEFEVTNATTVPVNLKLTVPSFFAKFPLTNGSSISGYLAPRTITITSLLAWSNASLATNTKVMTAATHFSTASATMSSQFLAIMGNASYMTVTIAFRWDWSVTFAANGTKVTSPWSVVSLTGAHPTTFYPAPTVTLVSTTSKTVQIGATFSTSLSGAISSTLFHSVLEYASSGNVIRNTPTNTPAGTSPPAVVAVKILPATGPLSPTSLLDHVRDVCSALLFSISVKAVYAPTVNLSIQVLPTTCGAVTLNGTSYANGAKPVLVPSPTAMSLNAGSCPGKTFMGWNYTNGAWIAGGHSASTTLTLSASGGFTARWG